MQRWSKGGGKTPGKKKRGDRDRLVSREITRLEGPWEGSTESGLGEKISEWRVNQNWNCRTRNRETSMDEPWVGDHIPVLIPI